MPTLAYPPARRPGLFACLALAACTMLTACASTRNAARTVPETMPDDFWFSLTVAAPYRAGDRGGLDATPPGERAARYVMETDRRLRSSAGFGANESTFGPVTRVLNSEQAADIYQRLRQIDAFNPAHPNATVFSAEVPTTPTGTTYLLTTYAQRRRVAVLVNETGDDTTRASLSELATTLSRLSWATTLSN